MLKDITLGQYFPGDSIVHRLDPRTKLILVVVYIVALFNAGNVVSYALMLFVLFSCIALSHVGLKAVFKGLRTVFIIILITALLNIFYNTTGTLLVQFWRIRIFTGGIAMAVKMVLRIMMLISGTFLLTYTTSPIQLTDAIERLCGPLKKLHLPIHELAMMMSIALRFIPTLIEETDKIMSAQKARGADFETGNLIQKARALMPLLVPLFVSAFRRAEELATAMECRCYHGDSGRTRMKQLTYAPRDFVALALGFVVLAAVFVLKHFGL
ncbi:MAG: energy-coupling factor transporter transmembrane protein EcfT [Oscillospiraceae bacterium]|nr:energy-coupling factor transporter transmembrane protein EcfT [Oscillospiraceae bacterium]